MLFACALKIALWVPLTPMGARLWGGPVFAPKGHQNLAQGFNPGFAVVVRRALKGRKISCNAAKAGGPNMSRNGSSGATFRARALWKRNPGLKPWAKSFCPFGAGLPPLC
jgi:hypothetical protein